MSQIIPIDKEFMVEGSAMISQTDIDGVITFANRKFYEVSNYTKDEVVGKSNKIVRHPDMPKLVFEKMWNNLSSGHTWNGLLKDIRKDGLFYWVQTEILPIFDNNNELSGFISAQRTASRKNIEEMKIVYAKMYEDQK